MANKKQVERSIIELNEALRSDPHNTDNLYKLGRAYESMGQFKEALAPFQTIVSLEPDDHESVNAVGLLQYKLGDLTNAIANLKRATTLYDRSPDFFADLGDALRAAGILDEARLAYEAVFPLALPNEEAVARATEALDEM